MQVSIPGTHDSATFQMWPLPAAPSAGQKMGREHYECCQTLLWYDVVLPRHRARMQETELKVNWAYVHAFGQTQDWDLSAQLAAGLHMGCLASSYLLQRCRSCYYRSCVYSIGEKADSEFHILPL